VQVALAAAHDEERCFRVLPRTMLHNTITGTVSGLRDCGTLVILFLDGEDGRVIPVLIERRGFCHLLEGEACGPDALIGRSVAWDNNLVSFIERQ
jgi:hypothetical protein